MRGRTGTDVPPLNWTVCPARVMQQGGCEYLLASMSIRYTYNSLHRLAVYLTLKGRTSSDSAPGGQPRQMEL